MFTIEKSHDTKYAFVLCDVCVDYISNASDGLLVIENDKTYTIHKECRKAFEKKQDYYLCNFMSLDMYLYYLIKTIKLDLEKCAHEAFLNYCGGS